MTQTLEHLLAIEVDATEARRLAGRLRFACLPTPATLDGFDYDAAPGVDRALIRELGTCAYLESATNVLLIGPPGTGKTHLVRRPGPRRSTRRIPHVCDHRGRPRRPLPQSRDRGPMGHLHAVLRRTHPARHRRTRLSAITGRSCLSPVSSCGTTVSENICRGHHQQIGRRMGRSPRRHHRRRSHARPTATPLRRPQTRRRFLPPARPPRTHPKPAHRHRTNPKIATAGAAHRWGNSVSTPGELS